MEYRNVPAQAVVGAVKDGLHSRPAAAQSLLREHATEVLQSPMAHPLLLHALPAAAASAQAIFLSAAVGMLPTARGGYLLLRAS